MEKPLQRLARIVVGLVVVWTTLAPPCLADPQEAILRRQEAALDQVGEVSPGAAPQVPLDLKTNYRSLFGGALWLKGGGFLQVDLVGDHGARSRPFSFAPSRFQSSSATESDTSGYLMLGPDARMGLRRTRLYLDLYSPYPRIRQGARAYGEIDFSGKDGQLNVRHLYLALPYLVLGRTNSAFKDPGAEPETLDPGGPNAKLGLRQQGARLTFPLGRFSLALGLEDPGPGISPQGTDLEDDGLKRRPDLTAHLRHDTDWGHLQLASVRRELVSMDPSFNEQNYAGWGLGLSGRVYTQAKNNLSFELGGGPGLGRYINDLAGTSSELGLDQSGRLVTQTAVGGYLAYQHWLDDKTRLNATVSGVGVDLASGEPDDSYQQGYKAALNVVKDVSPNMRVGLELQHGLRVSKDGDQLSGSRLGAMFRYSF